MNAQSQNRRSQNRRGATILELIVAAVLISTMISVAAPLTIRISHLSRDSQQLQLATDEVSDQLERLVMIPDDRLEPELDSLKISSHIAEILPDANLTGEVIDDELGRRIRLRLDWQRRTKAPPVTLIRWIRTSARPAAPASALGDES